MIPIIHACIDELNAWMSSNRLRLNPDKTEFIWLCSPNNLKNMCQSPLVVGGAVIKPSSYVRNLGCYFDNVLNLNHHVGNIVKACFFELRQLRYVMRTISKANLRVLLHAFVTSRLDYCNALLAAQPKTLIDKLQSVQNAAARLYAGVSRRSHVTCIFKDDLHWLKIPQRISYKICTLVHRCLNGEAPMYLTKYCVPLLNCPNRSARNRSAACGNLITPRCRTKTYGPRSFRVSGPTNWNALPTSLKLNGSYASFKKHLKTFLFNECYS